VKSLATTRALRAGVLGPLRFGVAQTGNKTTSDLFLFVRPDYKCVGKAANLQGVCALALGHWIGPRAASRRLIRQHKCLFAGTYKDGSDGTRTRDLRRDRPIRVQRRLPTSNLELIHLQGVCVFPPELRRMVA
jgi:hypothetical protein